MHESQIYPERRKYFLFSQMWKMVGQIKKNMPNNAKIRAQVNKEINNRAEEK